MNQSFLRTYVIWIFLFVSLSLNAQDSSTEAFWTEFDSYVTIEEKLNHIDHKGGLLLYSDPEALLTIADTAANLAKRSSNDRGLALALNFRASYLSSIGNIDSSIILLRNSVNLLKQIENSDRLLTKTYNILSVSYYRKGLHEIQLMYMDTALSLARQSNMPSMVNTILMNRAYVMSDLGFPEVSDSLLKVVLADAHTQKDEGLTSSVLIALGNIQLILENSKEALYYADQAKESAQKAGESRQIGASYFIQSRAYFQLGNIDLAKTHLDSCNKIYQSINYQVGLVQIDYLRLKLLFARQELPKARQLAQRVYRQNSEVDQEALQTISLIYAESDMADSALFFANLYAKSLKRESTDKLNQKVAELQLKHSINDQRRQMQAVKKEQEIERQRQAIIVGLAVLVILLLVAVVVIIRYSARNKALRQERDRERLEKELISEKELKKQKEREVAAKALYISEKNALLNDLIEDIKQGRDKDKDGLIQKLRNKIDFSFQTEKEIEAFENTFKQINPDFYENAKAQFPSLSHSELRLMAYIKMGLSIREIAALNHVEAASVKTARYRLRKKMELNKDKSLDDIVNSI